MRLVLIYSFRINFPLQCEGEPQLLSPQSACQKVTLEKPALFRIEFSVNIAVQQLILGDFYFAVKIVIQQKPLLHRFQTI